MLRNEVWLLPMNPGGGPVERGCGGDSWQKFFGEVFDLAIYASCDPPSRRAPYHFRGNRISWELDF